MAPRWTLFFGLLSVASPALAAAVPTEPVPMTFEAEPGCPSRDEVFADFAAHVREPRHAEMSRFDLRVVAEGTRFSGELVVTDSMGNRTLRRVQGSTCAEVAHALAFLAAVAVDLGVEPEAASPPPPEAPTSTRPPPARSSPMISPVAATARGFELDVAALSEIRGGLAPAPRFAAAVGLELADKAAGVFAPSAFLAIVESTGQFGDSQGSADAWLLTGRIALCPVRFFGPGLAVRPCVASEVGAVQTAGKTPIEPRTVTEPWTSVGAILRVRWSVAPRFFVDAEGGADAELFRARYFFEPNRTLYLTPPVAGRGAIGLGFRL